MTSTSPRPRAGAQECRAQGRSRHAGMGNAADPEEAGAGRRARYGADFGRTHERHQLRRLHPPRRAGELRRRPAGIRADWRDRGRRRHAASTCMSATRSSPAGAPPGSRRRRATRGYGAMFSAHIGQADEGCDFDFLAGTQPTAEPEIHLKRAHEQCGVRRRVSRIGLSPGTTSYAHLGLVKKAS